MQQVTHYVNADENDIKKALVNVKSESLSDRDAGFCSGEETDLDTEYHSPTDTSRDSLDVKDYSESLRNKNKRKCVEPRKVEEAGEPEAKLIKLEASSDRCSPCSIQSEPPVKPFSDYIKEEVGLNDVKSSPFRPWSMERGIASDEPSPIPSGYTPPYVSYVQDEPLALVVDKKKEEEDEQAAHQAHHLTTTIVAHSTTTRQDLRAHQSPQEVFRISGGSGDCDQLQNMSTSSSSQQELNNRYPSSSSNTSYEEKRKSSQCGGISSHHQRNYKNMTRERRIEANARERTRVHTISAAFETLRKCIPAYANNQKLSKLSVLRIACSYIMTLSRIAGYDYSIDQSAPSLAECVESVCNTIQMEGKTRKKKDDEE